jgi:hypothetical protein
MKVQWIGNKRKKELHRVEAGKPQPANCQLDEVPAKQRVVFKTAKSALFGEHGEAIYDPCAYCTKRFKSRR